MWQETISLNHLYDFDYTLKRWKLDPLTQLSREKRWVDLPVKLNKEHHVVRVQGYGTKTDPSFKIMSESEDRKEELLSYVRELFQWDNDLEEIHQHFLETNLGELFSAYSGTPIVKEFNLYDCLMKVIIHQQLNMKFANVLSERFVKNFGYRVRGVWFYPTASEVANISYESLRKLQFSQRKAEYVIDTSRMIASGELDLAELVHLKDEEVMKRLVKIRGIGPWTAENWLMVGLGREDLFPKADVGLQNAMKTYLNMEQKPTIEQLDEWSYGWAPYRSYASLTLWRSIEG